MASLHSPLALVAALVAPAPSDIERAHYGSPDNLFLILCFAVFPLYAAGSMRAPLRQGNRNPLIDGRRDRTARLSAIAAARFAARPLWVGFWCAARMRRGLTLAGTQCCFQLPSQPLTFLPQALNSFSQPAVSCSTRSSSRFSSMLSGRLSQER
jgi:hypothetical protein